MDLFNNPMIDSAKRALSPEQMEEYKKIGEYMYSDDKFKQVEHANKINSSQSDLLFYAEKALKSGLNPKELTQPEIQALYEKYGEEWYSQFDLSKNDILDTLVFNKVSRQQRRALEHKNKKKK